MRTYTLPPVVRLYKKSSGSEVANSTNKPVSVLYRSLLAIYARDIYQDLVKQRGPCGREQYCLQVTEALLGDVTSSMYLATFTEEELDTKQKNMKMIFEKVQDAMANQIDRSIWIDDPSRGAILMKLKSLKVTESPRAVFLDPASTFLSDRMQWNELSALDYFNNSVHLLRRYRQFMFAMYDKNPLLPEQMCATVAMSHITDPSPSTILHLPESPYIPDSQPPPLIF
uniref:Peptidase M13 N-terminal domain-containing protein n=1 Tax=Timema shepardi TaxID=629360 RepID=A0A7R9AN51_TIMSH|nr:unnamed protein product [Timema shepardi]